MHNFMNLVRIKSFARGIKADATDIPEVNLVRALLMFVVLNLPTAHLTKPVIINNDFIFGFHIVHGSMNNMKSKELQRLSLSVGDFIRYWGFRRIHGAIWTQVYLSKTPLSCTDLTIKLGLSKALISPALEELCDYKLIEEAESPNDKTKVYQAKTNINEVIKQVLKSREKKMLKQISENFTAFKKAESKNAEHDPVRVETLEEMIFSANMMLDLMLGQEDIMKLPLEFDS